MKKSIVLAVLMVIAVVSPALAFINPPVDCDVSTVQFTPCSAGGSPEVYEAYNQVFVNAGLANPGLTNNAGADAAQVSPNEYWTDLSGPGQASSFAFVSLTAANTNSFGVFPFGNPLGATFVSPGQTGFTFLGNGSNANPYKGASNPFPGGNFGFALKSTDGSTTNTWYSDPTLNADGFDHMLAYHLPGLAGAQWYIDTNNDGISDELVTATSETFLLAWEDLDINHPLYNNDFNDTVFLVTRVRPVPEPVSMVLFGSGLAGLVGLRRKNS